MSQDDNPYGERRRESLIDRRLRVARGEEVEEYDERDDGEAGDER